MTERVAENLALETRCGWRWKTKSSYCTNQPKVDATTRRIEGIEALIRWPKRELGLVPSRCIHPLLEATG